MTRAVVLDLATITNGDLDLSALDAALPGWVGYPVTRADELHARIADAAGAEVTTVFNITETGRNYTVRERAQVARMAASPVEAEDAFEPGTITLTANVHATFRLRPLE